MEYLEGILIGGVAISPLVVGLVALLKKVGLPDAYAPHANGALAAILWFLAAWFLPQYPQYAEIAQYVATVVVIYLSASGVYQFSKVKK